MTTGEEWIGGMLFMIILILIAMGIAKLTKSKDHKVFGYMFSFIMVSVISFAFGGIWLMSIALAFYFYFIWSIRPTPRKKEENNTTK
jgi:chromate transport protein ChrA